MKVTVLMPVYNGEKYLKEAIDSIIGQTFTDFELLIIDDGSTDKSADIIKSYTDTRIRLIKNRENIGLIKSLNKGIEAALGEYIARMDCDDIALPTRLEKQVGFFGNKPKTCMVASRVVLINADGKETGHWNDDINTQTFSEIYHTLPKANCIAHPSVMIRRNIVLKYLYNQKQKGSEDWDLWMRLAASGQIIEKINEDLLKYRIHPLSVTQTGNTGKKSQNKTMKVKSNFLLSQLYHFRINRFFFLTLYSWIRSIARYNKLYVFPGFITSAKRILTLNPIKVCSDYFKLKKYLSSNSHNLFFFLPYVHIGGAEQVHADIVACIKDKNPLVFFTGFSKNNAFLNLFENNARVFNIPHVLNYPVVGPKALKLVAAYINMQPRAKTFGCNSIFYYNLIGFLSPTILCIDLKHSFIYPVNPEENNSIQAVFRLNKRVFIAKKAIENAQKFYYDNNIPKEFAERIIYIGNYTNIPDQYPAKQKNNKLKVIYVGRSTPEKRVDIIAKIAEECNKQSVMASFCMVGDVSSVLDKTQYPFIQFRGEITDKKNLMDIYSSADVLLITSNTEGFPMSIMEAMAHGAIPVSTPVGDVPLHVINNETGFVTSSINESLVIKEMTETIKQLSGHRELVSAISLKDYEYAKKNFIYKNFRDYYRELLDV